MILKSYQYIRVYAGNRKYTTMKCLKKQNIISLWENEGLYLL